MPKPMKKTPTEIVIRSRAIREGDSNELPVGPETTHVAWVDGEEMDSYDKNTGSSDSEAIGSLIINLSYTDMPFVVVDVILEDLA